MVKISALYCEILFRKGNNHMLVEGAQHTN